MSASIHCGCTFQLSYSDLQDIIVALNEASETRYFGRDINGAKSFKELEKRCIEQRDSKELTPEERKALCHKCAEEEKNES